LWLEKYRAHVTASIDLYTEMIQDNIAPEQARALLGMNMYTHYYWTASFQAVAHFVNLRNHPEAQKEIQEYAVLVDTAMESLFPNAWKYKSGLK
jgi:thymidylate synthase (FAD)